MTHKTSSHPLRLLKSVPLSRQSRLGKIFLEAKVFTWESTPLPKSVSSRQDFPRSQSVHLRKCLSLAGLDMTFYKKHTGEGGTSSLEFFSVTDWAFAVSVFVVYKHPLLYLEVFFPEPLNTCASLSPIAKWDDVNTKVVNCSLHFLRTPALL